MIRPSNPLIQVLNIDHIRRIYELAGPDPKVLKAHKKIVSLFNVGLIGIPSWEITPTDTYFIYLFRIPDYNYYENVKIKGSRKIKIYENYILLDKSIPKYPDGEKGFPRYIISRTKEITAQNIRNNLFLKPGDSYCIFNEGSFETPVIPVTYSYMNDYDILYTLKMTRGKRYIFPIKECKDTFEEGVEGIREWIQNRIEILGENEQTYHRRILAKWMELAEKARQENI